MADCLSSVTLPSMRKRQKRLCQEQQKSRHEPVYNDSSSFGVRMLEKLGWEKGKGLGKLEDGIAIPVLPRFKQDSEGIGYAGEKDDQWTQHDADFSQLLQRLNADTAQGAAPNTAAIASLEEKSKQSRARVHYKKFTRGKDLSRASVKDLANIFGKRTLTVEQEPVREPVTAVDDVPEKTNNLHEYFQTMMKKRQSNGTAEGHVEAPEPQEAEQPKAKGKKKRKAKVEESPEETVEPNVNTDRQSKAERKSKTKAKLAAKISVIDIQCQLDGIVESFVPKSDEQQKKKSDPAETAEKQPKKRKSSSLGKREQTTEQARPARKKRVDKKANPDSVKPVVVGTFTLKPSSGNAEMSCPVKIGVLQQLDDIGFPGSNFGDIIGYGLTPDVKLVQKAENQKYAAQEETIMIKKRRISDNRKRKLLKKVSAFKPL